MARFNSFLFRRRSVSIIQIMMNVSFFFSWQVMEQYAKDGFAFLLEVFNNPDYLEQVSGLADLHKDMACIEDWDYPEGSEASEDSL